MAEFYIPTARWVYNFYYTASPRELNNLLNDHYSKWLERITDQQTKASWRFICGLVTLARERKIFNEETWEIKLDD